MFSLNRAQIIGNLTRDPEMRYTPNGQAVTSFGVATNRRWRTASGEQQEDTQFHDIVAWGKLAELCSQILHKGNKVYVEGRLQTRQWEAQDGAKRQRTEIVMENFVVLTPRAGTPAVPEEIPAPAPSTPAPEPVSPSASQGEPEAGVEPKKPSQRPAKKAAKGKEEKAEDKSEVDLDDIPF